VLGQSVHDERRDEQRQGDRLGWGMSLVGVPTLSMFVGYFHAQYRAAGFVLSTFVEWVAGSAVPSSSPYKN